MNYKQKALDHVRSVCPELMELSFGCRIVWKYEHALNAVSRVKRGKDAVVMADLQVSGLLIRIENNLSLRTVNPHDCRIIGHTPHLEHWLRGVRKVAVDNYEQYEIKLFFNSAWELRLTTPKGTINIDLTKDGENQDSSFYKTYCEIVGK